MRTKRDIFTVTTSFVRYFPHGQQAIAVCKGAPKGNSPIFSPYQTIGRMYPAGSLFFFTNATVAAMICFCVYGTFIPSVSAEKKRRLMWSESRNTAGPRAVL